MTAARTAAFEQLGKAVEDAFARWHHNHLHEFTLADGTVIIPVRWWDGEEPERSLDGAKVRLGRLRPGEQFAYTFDLGDNWQHLCTVAAQRADPLETLGIIPVGSLLPPILPGWGPRRTMSSGPEGSLGHEGGSPLRT